MPQSLEDIKNLAREYEKEFGTRPEELEKYVKNLEDLTKIKNIYQHLKGAMYYIQNRRILQF